MKINFQNMCSLRKISCGLIFSMAISLVACGSDNDEEGGDNGDDGLVEDTSIPGNSIVTVKQNRNIIFAQSSSGWVLYAGIGTMVYLPHSGKIMIISRLRRRCKGLDLQIHHPSWCLNDFNPEEGKYAWSYRLQCYPSAKLTTRSW